MASYAHSLVTAGAFRQAFDISLLQYGRKGISGYAEFRARPRPHAIEFPLAVFRWNVTTQVDMQ
jgi:hypothetical protein